MPLVLSGGGDVSVTCECGAQFHAPDHSEAIKALAKHDADAHPRKRAPTSEQTTHHARTTSDVATRCPVCGYHCNGHFKSSDYEGWRRVQAHNAGVHFLCHPDGCLEREW